MILREHTTDLPISLRSSNPLAQIRESVQVRLLGITPLRFAITDSDESHAKCLVSGLEAASPDGAPNKSVFNFVHREYENTEQFNVVFLVPTGIGAEIGGHAGDATPAARLLAEACDRLILHPNVVNASDINEMPSNSLYVEGSVIARLMMGTVGLVPARANRLLVIIDDHRDDFFVNAAINAVNAARASCGFICTGIVKLSPSLVMEAGFNPIGTASGKILGLERLFKILEEQQGQYDAVAISSVISVPHEFHQGYFDAAGDMVNPWGGVEAMLTHAISDRFNVPSAHCPMFESREIANMEPGVVDPRMAAEAISLTFFQCVLKGLHKSPRIVMKPSGSGVISARDVSCLVIPDGCVGLPTLAALEQGIRVVAVRENANLMKNNLEILPWRPGQLHIVENYWEAAGVLCALRAGIDPGAVRRPIKVAGVMTRTFDKPENERMTVEKVKRLGTATVINEGANAHE